MQKQVFPPSGCGHFACKLVFKFCIVSISCNRYLSLRTQSVKHFQAFKKSLPSIFQQKKLFWPTQVPCHLFSTTNSYRNLYTKLGPNSIQTHKCQTSLTVTIKYEQLVVFMVPLVGAVGLVITQAMSLSRTFQWAIKMCSDVANHMTSVERIFDYIKIKPEDKKSLKPPENWPKFGKLEFKNVYLSYIGDKSVLRNISFLIHPMEKVGIVGRTGAGKSSLVNAIFQLTNIKGSILIDGVNIVEVNPEFLRPKVSVIPQQPFLFSSSLRKNLDPLNLYNDTDLWTALESVELAGFVAGLSGGLDFLISENGTNISTGQKQLICLARAILSKNKLLILDEATASVDPQTDFFIQKTIRTKFRHCTVLTIAHRLNTVMDSDKVLVIEAGTVQEFDHPHKLLQNKTGIFHEMVWKTGSSTAEGLCRIAEENYRKYSVDVC